MVAHEAVHVEAGDRFALPQGLRRAGRCPQLPPGLAIPRPAGGGCRDERQHGLVQLEAELLQHGGAVVLHMLQEDLVAQRDAVGDDQHVHRLAGGRAVLAAPVVGAADQGAVGGVEARLVVSRPDDFVRDKLNVGERARRVVGVLHDLLVAQLQAVVVVGAGVVGVGGADVLDVPILPNAVGDAHDVVDDVAVGRLKAAEALRWAEVLGDAHLTRRAALRVFGQRNGVVGGHVPPLQWRRAARSRGVDLMVGHRRWTSPARPNGRGKLARTAAKR